MYYNKMKVSVGIFVLVLFFSIITFVYYIALEKGLFEKRYSFYFITSSVDSFVVGMPLKFSGFSIGTIDKISLKDDGKVLISFSVKEKNRKWITKDSSLIMKKPLIGSPHIEIESTIIGKELLTPNSELSIVLNDDINDMITKLTPAVDKTIKIIDSIDKITTYLEKDDSSLLNTLKNLETLTYRLSKEKSILTMMTGDNESTQSLIKSLNYTQKMMEEFYLISKEIKEISLGLEKNIIEPSSSSINQLEKILLDVNKKLNYIDNTVKVIGTYDKDLDEIREEVSIGLKKSNEIIEKVDSLLKSDEKKEIELP